jgi:hypothetical protein
MGYDFDYYSQNYYFVTGLCREKGLCGANDSPTEQQMLKLYNMFDPNSDYTRALAENIKVASGNNSIFSNKPQTQQLDFNPMCGNSKDSDNDYRYNYNNSDQNLQILSNLCAENGYAKQVNGKNVVDLESLTRFCEERSKDFYGSTQYGNTQIDNNDLDSMLKSATGMNMTEIRNFRQSGNTGNNNSGSAYFNNRDEDAGGFVIKA